MTEKPKGPFKVTADVFGVYTRGALEGKTNPKAHVSITMFGETVSQAMGKLNLQTGGALWKITDIAPTGEV